RCLSDWSSDVCSSDLRLSATVLLPRREVIVRQVSLPGVAAKDIDGAIRFQLDALHPYGEDEVAWGWSRLPFGAVLLGIARRAARSEERRVGEGCSGRM